MLTPGHEKVWSTKDVKQQQPNANVDVMHRHMDTLGFEPRAFRMRSGFDATTP